MRVEIKVEENIKEPYAVIYTQELNEEIAKLAKIIQKEEKEEFLLLEQEERYQVVKPSEIFMVRFEDNSTILYGKTVKYRSKKHLYEMEELLGKEFMRISKTTIINLKMIDSVEPSLGGTMVLKLKNGCKDYISRKYLKEFKNYIGL